MSPPSSTTREFLGLPRSYWLLWTGMLVNRLGGAVFPFLSIYLTRNRGLPVDLAGLVVGLHAAGGMPSGPVGGTLSDRFGRRPVMVVGTVLAAATMLALGLARSTTAIVALAPALGFCTGLAAPALHAAIADVVPPAGRTRAYGMMYWAINLGFSGAAVLAGALAERSFALLFVIDAATTLVFGAIVLAGVRETRPDLGAAAGRRGLGLLAPLGDRAFRAFAAIQLLVLLVFMQGVVTIQLDMRAHGLGTAEIGRLLALNGIIIILLQPLLLRVIARFAHVAVLATGAALTGIGVGATGLAGGTAGYALSIAIWTLGEIAFAGVTPALIADLAPPERRGTYQGAHQLVWGVAGAIGPALGTVVMGQLGAGRLWLACLLGGLVAAVLHVTVTGARLRRQREERANAVK
jgi:MFS family permease